MEQRLSVEDYIGNEIQGQTLAYHLPFTVSRLRNDRIVMFIRNLCSKGVVTIGIHFRNIRIPGVTLENDDF